MEAIRKVVIFVPNYRYASKNRQTQSCCACCCKADTSAQDELYAIEQEFSYLDGLWEDVASLSEEVKDRMQSIEDLSAEIKDVVDTIRNRVEALEELVEEAEY
jgi:peptidoglycan hydrolase CwlO-like protein